MKAVVLDRYGNIDGVRAGEVPDRICEMMTSWFKSTPRV